MTLAIMLTSKGFAADSADKRPFICVGSKMGAEVVRPCKPFGTKGALKRRRMLLLPSALYTVQRGPFGVGKI